MREVTIGVMDSQWEEILNASQADGESLRDTAARIFDKGFRAWRTGRMLDDSSRQLRTGVARDPGNVEARRRYMRGF